jgi:WD40 repeat protein
VGRLGAGVWDLKEHKKLGFFSGNYTQAVALSPDGKLLAVGGDRNAPAVTVWDIDNSTQIGQLRDHEFGITELTFSPDGSMLAAVDNSAKTVLWSAPGLQRQRVFENVLSGFPKLAFAPNGDLLAVCTGNKGSGSAIRIWNTRLHGPEQVLQSNFVHFSTLTFSPDGSALVAGGQYWPGAGESYAGRRVVFIWDTKTWEVRRSEVFDRGMIFALQFVPESSALAIAADQFGEQEGQGELLIWDTKSCEVLKSVPGKFYRIGFASNGRELLASGGGDVRIYRLSNLIGRQLE